MASDKYTEHMAANAGKPDVSGILRIREKLKEILKPDRYEHSISVSFTSICLAMRYGEDLHRAELAGLVHDCAKQFKHDELIRRCREDGITLTEDMLKAPQVIHSVYGAVYARK
ncbi:MAG: HD domain-containing protein, partial [Oribacterium sp.]|nr:HD domain-containing protein [Oribacterium sp.]